jgi:predicted permease
LAGTFLILGFGVGANTATFSVVDALFFRPPPIVANPAALRRIYVAGEARGEGTTSRIVSANFPFALSRRVREATRTDIGLYNMYRDSVTVDAPSRIPGAQRRLANAEFFRVLQIRPYAGRTFSADEDYIGRPAAVAILSHSFWARAFGQDPSIIGSVVRINASPTRIVGIAPAGFTGIDADRTDLWMPLGNFFGDANPNAPWWETSEARFAAIVRLRDETSPLEFETAAGDAARAAIVGGRADTTARVILGPIHAATGPAVQRREVRIAFQLAIVSALLLIVALANVSNLLLVRVTSRGREMGIRQALGMGRVRLFRHLAAEGFVLAAVSSAGALLFGYWASHALRGLLFPDITWAEEVIDGRAICFVAIITVISAVLMSVLPALHAQRSSAGAMLRVTSRTSRGAGSAARGFLIAAQTGLAVFLLVAASLFLFSLQNAEAVDVGYDSRAMLSIMPLSDSAAHSRLLESAMPAVLKRLAAIPGVQAIAAASYGPLRGESRWPVFVPGRDSLPVVGGVRGAGFLYVTPEYFQAAGIAILRGRGFTEADRNAVVVSKAMAEAFWPGEDAIGQCLVTRSKTGPCHTVVGVAADVHRAQLDERVVARYYLYRPDAAYSSIVIRAERASHDAIRAVIVPEVRRLVPTTAVVRVKTIPELLARELRPWRTGAVLLTALGAVSLLVVAIGVYSVVAYAFDQRRGELGLRAALGATGGNIVGLVLRDGMRPVVVGAILGTVAVVLASRVVSITLYGVAPRDPMALMLGLMGVLAIGFFACLVPAWRASRVSPAIALESD